MTIVDEAEVVRPSEDGLLTHGERRDLEARLERESGLRVRDAVAGLTLSAANIVRAQEVLGEFDVAEEPSEVGERLLHELVAGELAVARELQDIEGAMAALLGRTVTDPALSAAVAKSFREAVALSNAVRRRMEGSLSAAAGLRAQRLLLTAQRGRIGG